MRLEKLCTVLIITMIIASLVTYTSALDSAEIDSKLQPEVLAKIDPDLIAELPDSEMDKQVDAIVVLSK